MVDKKCKSKRMLEHIVVIHFVDDKGILQFVEKLPPRVAYRQKADEKLEFVVVTKDNRDYRAYVKLGTFEGGYPCYRAVAKLSKFTPRDSRKFKSTISIDKDVHERISLIKEKDRITYAEAVRQVIEWGLETVEKDYDFEV